MEPRELLFILRPGQRWEFVVEHGVTLTVENWEVVSSFATSLRRRV